ncbi:MAG: hypothetical protein J6N52_05740 [Clostridia bacterium]|nr:hypothetical protein [Clostridia bacterium]
MKRFFSALICTAVICGVLPGSVYSDGKTVMLSTAEEFVRFAGSCVSDAYSEGMQVVLKNDIDFTGVDVIPVEIFSGSFDGCGYTLKNIRMSFEGDDKGLFIRVAKGAEIVNLNIEGNFESRSRDDGGSVSTKNVLGKLFKNTGVKSELTEDYVEILGAVAAVNEGTVRGCSFKGSVSGESTVGAIVGYNRNSGMLEECVNYGAVQGNINIGGIAGKNDGYIKNCENKGNINTNANEKSSCIGGIAGSSDGAVQGAVNSGEVGYINLGDNIGGIAGKQSGLITECTNSGKVFGRRGVGGIAGRFEPFSNISAETLKEDVKSNIDDVKTDIDNAKEELASLPADWKQDIRELSKDLLGVGGEGLKLSDNLTRLTDSIVDNTTQVSGSTKDVLDSVNSAVQDINGNNSVSKAADSVSDLTGRVGKAVDKASEKLDSADTEGIGENVRNVLSGLADVNDETKAAVKSLDGALTETIRLLQDNDGTMDDLFTSATGLMDEAAAALENGDANAAQSLENIRERLDELDEELIEPLTKNLKTTHAVLNNTLKQLSNSSADISDAVSGTLGDIDRLLRRRIERLEKIDSAIDEIRRKIDGVIEHIKGKLPENARLPEMLLPTVYAAEAEDSSEKSDPESIDIPLLRPVAGIWVEDALIRYSYNSGEINGIEYTGGIAGAVGSESKLKTGENETVSGAEILEEEGFAKAVVNGSVNEGRIISKNGNAGGISGFSNIGIIKNCIGSGEIDASEGKMAGGIAGESRGKIEKCIGYAKTSAKSDVGGIAGKSDSIRLCYAFPEVTGGTERTGAIAGNNGDTIEKNYFIDEGLGGIDGADFEGRAAALSKDDMTGDGIIPYLMDGFISDDWYMGSGERYLPQLRFLAENDSEIIGGFLKAKSDELARLEFTVSFVIDGETVQTLKAEYGTVVDSSQVPELPVKEGFNPSWDGDISKKILRNTVFTCVYNDATTTISSGEKPPMILVEGNFKEDTKLIVDTLSLQNVGFDGYKVSSGYTISTSDGYSDKVRVRVRDEKGKCAAVGIPDTSGMHVTEAERDGSYIVFELEKPGGFYLLKKKADPIGAVIIILLVLVLACTIFILAKRFKAGKKKLEKTQPSEIDGEEKTAEESGFEANKKTEKAESQIDLE